MYRPLLASLVVFSGLVLTPDGLPPVAHAQVNIDITIGTNLSGGRRITCAEGERILRRRGWRDVQRRNCTGRYFEYRGRRLGIGARYDLTVRARDGRVVEIFRRR
jgi:hypothetical protein